MKTRAELKREHRERKVTAGIFRITNTATGKYLLGSSLNLEGIWNGIRFRLETGSYVNRELQQDWKQSGAENFSYEVLDSLVPSEGASSDAELKLLEALWLEELQPDGETAYNTKGVLRSA